MDPASSSSSSSSSSLPSGAIIAYPVRFQAGDDLVSSIEDYVRSIHDHHQSENATAAVFVLSAVGSLEHVTLRMANAGHNEDGTTTNAIKTWHERLEILSLSGTVSRDGKHLHMSVSDQNGTVYGGHVIAGTIFTTLELVLGVLPTVSFARRHDPRTGFPELVVEPHHLKPQAHADGAGGTTQSK